MALTAMLLSFKVCNSTRFRGSAPQISVPVSVTDRRSLDEFDPFYKLYSRLDGGSVSGLQESDAYRLMETSYKSCFLGESIGYSLD
jgi:hypothetical protein